MNIVDDVYDQYKLRGIEKHDEKHENTCYAPSNHTPKRYRTRPQLSSRCRIPRHYESVLNRNEINHKVVDLSVVENINKVGTPRFREHWKQLNPKRNFQNHQYNHQYNKKNTRKKQKESKCVHLPLIHSKLYISNIQFAETYDPTEYKFDTIINLTQTEISKRSNDTTMYNMNIKDGYSRAHDHDLQTYWLEKIVDVISESVTNDETILIHCNSGINRAPYVVLLFAIGNSNLNMNVDQWIAYIDNEKITQGYKHWDTFTNLHFIHTLEAQNVNNKMFKIDLFCNEHKHNEDVVCN